MGSDIKLFISHTTHDRRDTELAHKLAEGLRSVGVAVWIAPESIPSGDEWEPALRTVIGECTHFLVVLSESAVRAPEVLRELALVRARYEQRGDVRILPLRVSELLDFEHREFLSSFQNVPYESQFAGQLRRLGTALSLPPAVPALFRTLIEETTRHFVGRERVFSAIGQFLANEQKGCFTIVGDPGEGKTTILAEYVRRTGCLAHFNMATAGLDTTAQFYGSLCQQLRDRYDVTAPSRPGETPSFSLLIAELLQQASLATPSGEPFVLAIDALDEVRPDADGASTNVLHLPQVLPRGAFLIMSGRRREVPFYTREPLHVLDLADFPGDNRRDVERFLMNRLRDVSFEPWLRRRGLTLERAVTELADRSENNFMYLHYVLAELTTGALGDDAHPLPTGLQGYYRDHWRRMGMSVRPARTKLQVLYILSILNGPISVPVLADIIQTDPFEVRATIHEWREFLHAVPRDGETWYRLYHSSFQEFLHSREALRDAGDLNRYRTMVADYFTRSLLA